MEITKPTYLIAELDGDVAPLVLEMRKRYNPNNQYWPADITIAGSSGVGTLKHGQSLARVVQVFTPIIEAFGFSDVEFLEVGKFSDTGIYYLNPAREKFDLLHNAITESGILFEEIRWPYNPHCTLCWHDTDSQEYKDHFGAINVPVNSYVECFSLYQPEVRGGIRVHKF